MSDSLAVMPAPGWTPTRRNLQFDAAIAIVLAAASALSLYISSDPAITNPALADYRLPIAVACITALHALLALRRRWPIAALLASLVAYVPMALEEVPEPHISPVVLLILLYTAGAYGGRHRNAARTGFLVVIAGLIVFVIVRAPAMPYEGRVPREVLTVFTLVANVVSFGGAWMLGDVVRVRRQREQVLEARTAALAAAQADLAHRAVVDERIRIARELHDVLAHHVSLMGVQAGAARRVLDSRPADVPDLLGSIEGSSREALVELQRLLGLLRQDEAAAETISAQPRLEGLDELAEQMRDAGLRVELAFHGDPGSTAVPAGVELSAYRIVQEALTNALKHAGPRAVARVEIRRTGAALQLCVSDDGGTGGTAAAHPRRTDGVGGHGIVGMRERVNLLGGELRVGPRPSGGFEVRAWLPLAAEAPAT